MKRLLFWTWIVLILLSGCQSPTSTNPPPNYHDEALLNFVIMDGELVVHLDEYAQPNRMTFTIDDDVYESDFGAFARFPMDYANQVLETLTIDAYINDQRIYHWSFTNAMILVPDDEVDWAEMIVNPDAVEYLWLADMTEREDLSFVAGMDRLRLLDIRPAYNVSDITALESLNALEHLYMGTMHPADAMDVLENLDLISFASANMRQIQTLHVIAGMKRLEYLHMGSYFGFDLEKLSRLPALRHVKLINCSNVSTFGMKSLLMLPRLEHLTVSGTYKLTEIPVARYRAPLKELRLVDCDQLTDISGLASLSTVQSLTLSQLEGIENLDAVGEMDDLQRLTLTYLNNVEDVRSLRRLINVRYLNLDLPSVDVTPLLCNPVLENVVLWNVYDIQMLSVAENLKALHLLSDQNLQENIQQDYIVDLSALENMQSLEWLVLMNLPHRNADTIQHCTQLKKLRLTGSDVDRISDLHYLAPLENLESALIDCTYAKDVSALSQLTSIRRLQLFGLHRALPHEFDRLDQLEELDISYGRFFGSRPLSVLRSMDHIKSLHVLDCASESYTMDMSFVEDMTGMEQLILDWENAGKTLPDLSALHDLNHLTLMNGHHLTDVQGLWDVPNVGKLYLYELNLGDVSPLGRMTSLRELHIRNCTYDSLDVLDEMPWLELTNIS